jgi:hypothetical protein
MIFHFFNFLYLFRGSLSSCQNNPLSTDPFSSFRVCLVRAKNSIRIEELRIVSEDSEKIVIFRLAQG